MTAADGLGQAGHCPSSCAFAGIFFVGLAGWTEHARPSEPTLRESGKTLSAPDERSSAFVNTSLGQRGTKGNTVFRGAGAGEAEGGALLRLLNRRGLVVVPEGELCAHADVFVTLHRGWEASRADLRRCRISQTHRSSRTHSSEPESRRSIIRLHDDRTSRSLSFCMHGTRPLRKLWHSFFRSCEKRRRWKFKIQVWFASAL